MKIATYNVNSVNARLPVLLRWLAETQPDVACLQELKAAQEKFPADALREAGYHAIWHGQKAWNGVTILARSGKPVETGRGLTGDPDDVHSRYLEGTVDGVRVGCLYLPNGNPAPGPKFDYKLRWLSRFAARAAELVGSPDPVILAGDYNVIPEELDVYDPAGWEVDALSAHRPRAPGTGRSHGRGYRGSRPARTSGGQWDRVRPVIRAVTPARSRSPGSRR
jgi:exodeoxyribonuclease-3